MNKLSSVILGMAVAATVAAAEETKTSELETHTELSYINTAGNTETESFALEGKAEQKWEKHGYEVRLEAFYSKDNELTTKNKWMAEANYDYSFTKKLDFDYLIGYKADKFSNYNYQFYTGPGLKYRVVKNEVHRLKTRANILYSQDDVRANLASVPPTQNETKNYASYLLRADYRWWILDNLKFIQEASYRSQVDDADNYFIYTKTAVENKINSIFSMGVSYKVDYVNQVEPGVEHTDRTLLVSVIIDY